MSDYFKKLQHEKIFGKPPKEKKVYRIPAKSAKKIISEKIAKELTQPDEDSFQEIWFKKIRKRLTGMCGCGCGQPSQKKDDKYFRHSCCHLFPKRLFESVRYDLDNFVERAFFGGCHTQFDESGMDKWPTYEDWPEIKEKFHLLAPKLTEAERGLKFYSSLEKLVYAN